MKTPDVRAWLWIHLNVDFCFAALKVSITSFGFDKERGVKTASSTVTDVILQGFMFGLYILLLQSYVHV